MVNPKSLNNLTHKGRPKGAKSDFTIAKRIIFEVFTSGQKEFKAEMIRLRKQNPVAFYLKFVAPIQPKDLEISGRDGGPIELSWEK